MARGFLQGILSSILMLGLGALFASSANAGLVLKNNYDSSALERSEHFYGFLSGDYRAVNFIAWSSHSSYEFQLAEMGVGGAENSASDTAGLWHLAAWVYVLTFDHEATYGSSSRWQFFNNGDTRNEQVNRYFRLGLSIWSLIFTNDYHTSFSGEGSSNGEALLEKLGSTSEEVDGKSATAVSEPSALAFIVIGLLSLGIIRLRRI